ncbi:unnamed protein product [Closterium sp. NIES-64]|nr:unnamed protein product [Closterium sp. NIES-64]
MVGKRPRRGRAAGRSAAPTPPEAPAELAPVLLRAVAALVAREGDEAPSRPREPQSSRPQSSDPAASSPVVASPGSTSVPWLSTGDPPPPPLPSLVPPASPIPAVVAPPPGEPPQRQHPLVPAGPVLEARFPPPRARSPELPPDSPDPEDDERCWNGEMWESRPQPATLWGRDWDIHCDVVKDILRWEKRMVAVGECMSHVATVLEQLHAGLVARNLVLRDPQLTEPKQGVVRDAAAQGLWRLLRLPLEPENPELDEGPGARAFRRVAKAAEESPLELVPALAVLLRWMRRRFYVLNRV